MHNRDAEALFAMSEKDLLWYNRKPGPPKSNELELTTRDEPCI